jgi:hypothetical protein
MAWLATRMRIPLWASALLTHKMLAHAAAKSMQLAYRLVGHDAGPIELVVLAARAAPPVRRREALCCGRRGRKVCRPTPSAHSVLI